MNTKMMEQFEIMDTDMLACVEGGKNLVIVKLQFLLELVQVLFLEVLGAVQVQVWQQPLITVNNYLDISIYSDVKLNLEVKK